MQIPRESTSSGAGIIFRVGLEKRSHPVGHPGEFLVARLSERGPVEDEPIVQFAENIIQIQEWEITCFIHELR